MLEANQIHLGDCLELMHQIPDQSIDMVLADLPYGTTACAWDSIIPLEPLWEHYKRVIKPRGAIVLTASQPFTTLLIGAGGLDWFKYKWTWDKVKPSNQLNGNKQPLRRTEEILVFYQKQCLYNPQKVINPNGEEGRSRYAYSRKNEMGETTGEVKQGGVSGNYESGKLLPVDILQYSKPSKPIHPTQKPIALFSYLIRTYTNPGDLVLDNAAGSGTTAIAAIDTGRNWLLIEKDPEYYQIAKDRITERLKQPFLPGLSDTAHNQSLHGNTNLGSNSTAMSQQKLFE